MNRLQTLTHALTVLMLALGLAACGGDSHDHGDHTEKSAQGEAAAHALGSTGPHGGAMGVVGDHVAHIEAAHDDLAGRVTLYVVGEDGTDLALDRPPVLSLLTDGGSTQVTATAVGKAWVFEHEALKEEPDKARFRLAIGGRTYQPDMPCAHDHEGEHEHEAEAEHDEHGGHEHEAEAEHDEHGGHEAEAEAEHDDDGGHDHEHEHE